MKLMAFWWKEVGSAGCTESVVDVVGVACGILGFVCRAWSITDEYAVSRLEYR